MKRLFLTVGLVVLLEGCSSEPSEEELKSVVQAQYDAINGLSGMFGIKQDLASLKSVEKVGCASVRDKVYRCDVVVSAINVVTGEGKGALSLLLMKTQEGWEEIEQ